VTQIGAAAASRVSGDAGAPPRAADTHRSCTYIINPLLPTNPFWCRAPSCQTRSAAGTHRGTAAATPGEAACDHQRRRRWQWRKQGRSVRHRSDERRLAVQLLRGRQQGACRQAEQHALRCRPRPTSHSPVVHGASAHAWGAPKHMRTLCRPTPSTHTTDSAAACAKSPS
jgi:hypothetical protein